MGDVVHIAPAETSRVPLLMTDLERKALDAVQKWLDRQEDGAVFLTHHSMDTDKFELVGLIVGFAEANGST